MANILDFKPRTTGAAIRRGPKGPAEIIIFPGVRYERMAGDGASAARREASKPCTALVPVLLQG